uniref:Uncharacterized protein n=1 Tax=viral metagenome TaxID=1070528 RepID=A0A6C0I8E8_9ZZZZ
MDSHFVANVLCQVIFFFIFVTIFYFTYAKTVENNVLVNQLDFLIDQSITPEIEFICKNNLYKCEPLITEIAKYLDPNQTSVQRSDNKITEQNNQIMSNAIHIVVITSVIVFLIIFALYFISRTRNSGFFKRFNLLNIIFESTVIIIFVAITEFVFLTYFGSRFITVDVNKVKVALLEKFRDYFNP